MNKLKKIINSIEKNILIKNYKNNIGVFDLISKFIINKKLILYGGYAINLILSKNNKIYKSYTSADFDCFSFSAKKTAFQLVSILKKNNFKYLKIKLANHKNTYKVFVGNINVIDITNVDKKLFDIFIKIHKQEKKTILKKYYKEKYNLMPFNYLKRNLYFELSRPQGSYFRWEKLYERLQKILYDYPIKNPKKINNITKYKLPSDLNYPVKKVLNYIKYNNCPIIDSYAIKLLKNINNSKCCRIHKYSNYITVLSKTFNKTKKDINNIILNSLDNNKYELILLDRNDDNFTTDILEKRVRFLIKNKSNGNIISLISIINVSDYCFSVQKINGYTVGSYYTILTFLYSHLLIYQIYNYINEKNNNLLKNTLYYINFYEHSTVYLKIKKLFKIKCYGDEKTREKIYIDNWNKKLTLLKK
tara:strand:- start:2436 stop:3689 length:1254 start_codon:yes stop_codon:yes gene_type:complete